MDLGTEKLHNVNVKDITCRRRYTLPGLVADVLSLVELLRVLTSGEVAVEGPAMFVLCAVLCATVPEMAVKDCDTACGSDEVFFLWVWSHTVGEVRGTLLAKVAAGHESGTAIFLGEVV